MSITKASDFVADFYIPNITDSAPLSDTIGNGVLVVDFIQQYEDEALEIILGNELATLFKQEFDAAEANRFKADAPAEYPVLYHGELKFRGIKRALVAYIFYHFYRMDQSQYTGIGTKELKSENTKRVSNIPLSTLAWRTWYDLVIGNFAYTHPWLFGENPVQKIIVKVVGTGIIYGNADSPFDSLYTYLTANAVTYPEWVGTYFRNTNQFGL